MDVVIVGAGPAGTMAATLLARAGARVAIVERGRMPRSRLCGDTLNPGALAVLRRHGLDAAAEQGSVRIDGVRVTGDGGLSVDARYPATLSGRALPRETFDGALVDAAIAAGVELIDGTIVRSAIIESGRGGERIAGVRVGAVERPRELRAAVTIAADGCHSTLAFGLGLMRHPARPRRWAIGATFDGMHGLTSFSETHIRGGHYVTVAPLPGGLAKVCLVKPAAEVDRALRQPAATLMAEIALELQLRDRMASAVAVSPVRVLGPLAVDPVPGVVMPPGLLLAGDASGVVDPMTGDGIRFALQGGDMAAQAALKVLAQGWEGVHDRLVAERDRRFAAKWRFNRTLRAVVGSPVGVWAASRGARLAPAVVRALVARASDCDLALSTP